MKLTISASTDQGQVRSMNQDFYLVDESRHRFFIVADGMGGHVGGREASQTATQVIADYLTRHWEKFEPAELLERAIREANQAILVEQQSHPERAEMGTTAVVVLFPDQGKPWQAHVGDSRLYRWRNHHLQQMTRDHTWIAQAVEAGNLTPAQARAHPWRHVLSQCLGRPDLTMIDINLLDVEPGDRLLLCSDGLTEELPDEEIEIYLGNGESDPQILVDQLVADAKAKGGKDNITIVLIDIGE